MATLVLHPGSPKTATSTLQHVLRANRSRLAYSGVGLLLPEDIRGQPFLGHFLAAYRGEDRPMLDQMVADFFGPTLSKYSVVICSEETFCHDYMPSRKFGMGGIDRSNFSADVLSRSGAADTRIVLSIRPQLDLLISTYTHFVHRHRESRDFASWVAAEVDLASLLWKPAVAAFNQQFGRHSVKTVSLSIARERGISGYIEQMLESLGVSHAGLDLTIDAVHNPSPSRRAVELCRILNREILHPKRSETVNSTIVNTFPVSEFGKFTASPWRLPAEIQKLYDQDHAEALQ